MRNRPLLLVLALVTSSGCINAIALIADEASGDAAERRRVELTKKPIAIHNLLASATAALDENDLIHAERIFAEAQRQAARYDHPSQEAYAAIGLAIVAERQGHRADAARWRSRGDTLIRHLPPDARHQLGDSLDRQLHDPTSARTALEGEDPPPPAPPLG